MHVRLYSNLIIDVHIEFIFKQNQQFTIRRGRDEGEISPHVSAGNVSI